MMHYFSNLETFGNLGLFWNVMTPPSFWTFPNWNLGIFCIFNDPPKFQQFLILMAPLSLSSCNEVITFDLLLYCTIFNKIYSMCLSTKPNQSNPILVLIRVFLYASLFWPIKMKNAKQNRGGSPPPPKKKPVDF